MNSRLIDIAQLFAIDGTAEEVQPYKSGHIHRTYLSRWRTATGERFFIHQRINNLVFQDVPRLMENIARVTTHIRGKIETARVGDERTLEIIPARDGKLYALTEADEYWRTYSLIENSESFDVCRDLAQAREAARMLGCFQGYLLDLDPHTLHETIPHFTSSPHRLEQLRAAVAADAAGRVNSSRADIDFALQRGDLFHLMAGHLASGAIATRVTHNDMKINNVLFSGDTGRGVGLVDLDTCMPGYSLFDFGDLVRNSAVAAGEDETNLAEIFVDLERFDALAGGYLASARKFLSKLELELLPIVPRLVALTLGSRFLADHLNGDAYFRIHRPGHNLDRARAQFQIVRSMEENYAALQSITAELAR